LHTYLSLVWPPDADFRRANHIDGEADLQGGSNSSSSVSCTSAASFQLESPVSASELAQLRADVFSKRDVTGLLTDILKRQHVDILNDDKLQELKQQLESPNGPVDPVAEGGFNSVYKVKWCGAWAALRVPKPKSSIGTPVTPHEFCRMLAAHAIMESDPRVIKLVAVHMESKTIVMQWHDGCTLKELLDRGEPILWTKRIHIVAGLLDVCAELLSNFVGHFDIKVGFLQRELAEVLCRQDQGKQKKFNLFLSLQPDNVMVADNGDVTLIDLEMAILVSKPVIRSVFNTAEVPNHERFASTMGFKPHLPAAKEGKEAAKLNLGDMSHPAGLTCLMMLCSGGPCRGASAAGPNAIRAMHNKWPPGRAGEGCPNISELVGAEELCRDVGDISMSCADGPTFHFVTVKLAEIVLAHRDPERFSFPLHPDLSQGLEALIDEHDQDHSCDKETMFRDKVCTLVERLAQSCCSMSAIVRRGTLRLYAKMACELDALLIKEGRQK